MGHDSNIFKKRQIDVDRKERADKRKKSKLQEETEIDVSVPEAVEVDDQRGNTAISSQTNITMDELAVKFEQLSFASKKIAELTKKIENSPYGIMEDIANIEKWKYYTGFPYDFVNSIMYPIVKDYIPCSTTSALSTFNQLLLTLIKLRLDTHFKDLAYHFKISPTTASRYFEVIIDMATFIMWPDHNFSKNVPSCFKEAFHEKNTIIIDCFEVFIEKPTPLLAQQQSWSTYKHHNTVKFLTGITPQETICYISDAWCGRASDKQIVESSGFLNFIEPGNIVLADRGFLIKDILGILNVKLVIPAFTKGITPQETICYISDAWCGRASDKQIVESSGFLNFIEPGNIVLADRGFLIKDILGILNVKLVIPAFTKGRNQLDPLEIEETRNIAHVRVHIERIIGFIKNKFGMFKGTIPISMLRKNNDPEHLNVLDKIVFAVP